MRPVRRGAGLATATWLALVAIVVSITPGAAAQQDASAPVLALVEIRPNGSLFVEWSQTGASRYELSVVPAGASPAVTTSVDGSSLDGVTVRKILRAGSDWPGVRDTSYDLSVRAQGSDPWSASAPIRWTSAAPIEVDVAATTTDSVTPVWTPAAPEAPFVRYDVFLADEGERLSGCRAVSIGDRLATSTTLRSEGTCGSGSLRPATDYTVGVRHVLHLDPLVVTSIEATTAWTVGANAPSERFATGQVDGVWSIVDRAGRPVVWNGTNLRRGDYDTYVVASSEFTAIRDVGFDTIRVVMSWDRFQPAPDRFDSASFAALDAVIDGARTAGLDIVLDPIHIAGGGNWHVPWWAWHQSNDGSNDWTKMLEVLDENAHDYLTHVTQRYRDEDHVVAIDLVNEPREPVIDRLDDNNWILMDLYHDLIETVRDLDDDKPLVLGAYYGSAAIKLEALESVRHATVADPSPVAADYEQLIWSFHDYYVGNEGNPWSDGLTWDGYPERGRSADGTLVRTESWDGAGCYPSGTSASTCTFAVSRPNQLIPSMRSHAARHVDVAQQAAMPTYVGEFGIPHASSWRSAWSGGDMFFSDKVGVYDELGLSRTQWAWSTQVDQTYGLYDRIARSFHPWTDYVVGDAVAPLPGSGDVNCDGGLSVIDALLIAQYAALVREGASATCADGAIDSADGDLNSDQRVNIIDALLVAQCVVDDRGSPHC